MNSAKRIYNLKQGIEFAQNSNQVASISNLDGVVLPTKGFFYVWFRLTTWAIYGIDTTCIIFFGSGNGAAWFPNNRFIIYLVKTSGTVYFYMETRSAAGVVIAAPSFFPVIEFKPHLFIVSYDTTVVGAQKITLYYDGVQVGQLISTNIGIPAQFYATNYIGKDTYTNITDGHVQGEQGFVSGVNISAAQAKLAYSDGKGCDMDEVGAFTYLWRFKYEGNGNDSSGNGRHLSITGSPTYPNFM